MSQEVVEEEPKFVFTFEPSYQNKSCSECQQDVKNQLSQLSLLSLVIKIKVVHNVKKLWGVSKKITHSREIKKLRLSFSETSHWYSPKLLQQRVPMSCLCCKSLRPNKCIVSENESLNFFISQEWVIFFETPCTIQGCSLPPRNLAAGPSRLIITKMPSLKLPVEVYRDIQNLVRAFPIFNNSLFPSFNVET